MARRLLIVALLLPACGAGDDGEWTVAAVEAVGGAGGEAGGAGGEPAFDGAAGAGGAGGAPVAGARCDEEAAFACDGDRVLFCRHGYGGARWVDRGPCPAGSRCAAGYGCAPLPACGDPGLIACVGHEVFACDAGGTWRWRETCPEMLPCVHGRGCPNELGVGTECDPTHGPRCHEGRILRCVERGMIHRWEVPADCPEGSACLSGEGCVRPDGCHDRDTATCLDSATAIYCTEQDDGTLGWSDPVACARGCSEGTGCNIPCRRTKWIGGCRN